MATNLQERQTLSAKLSTDRNLQALERARCRQDRTHWFNFWAWTYDPRLKKATHLPFLLFDNQVACLQWVQEREDNDENGLIEKSRDSGATWLLCGYDVHAWLFRPEGYAGGWGSRKLELVDTLGDLNTIFEKMRHLLRHLPDWMLPETFDMGKHTKTARIFNPVTKALLFGEGGDDIGRGGRATTYKVDEAAFIERPDLVDRALSQTTNCRLDISTPNGPGNPFAAKRESGTTPVFTLHWRDDPRKNDRAVVTSPEGTRRVVFPWYESQKAKYDAVTIAQEIDIDYTASVEGIAIPAIWVAAAVNLELPYREGEEAQGPFEAGLDIAGAGKNKTVLLFRRGPQVVGKIHDWSGQRTTQTAWMVANLVEAAGCSLLKYDADGIGATVADQWEDSEERKIGFRAWGIRGGDAPMGVRWPSGRTSKEWLLNRRAELWWLLRHRFEKTYEYVHDGIEHPAEEMISIPNHRELIAQISQPLAFVTSSGKTKIESKEDMAKRGVKSPDFADALVYAFAPAGGGIVTTEPVRYHLPHSAAEQHRRQEMRFGGLPCPMSPYQDEQGRLYPGGEIPAEVVEQQAAARGPAEPEAPSGYGVLGVGPHWWRRW
ncbi:MAG TPA: hypothetical protein VKT32_00640 [Chthonomonadaceae bacterium]|nr:hypothetical protein [Chthonomonadaceae bacterium]